MSTDVVTQNEIGAISHGPFRATTTGLVVTEDDVPYEVWEAYGSGIRRVEGAIQWLIGDWLNYGERKYGEMYTQGLEPSEYDLLAKYKWVSGAVESCFRKQELSWSHHKEVAKLEPEEQAYWLDEAIKRGYTMRGLRDAIRDEDKESVSPEGWCARHSVVCPLEV